MKLNRRTITIVAGWLLTLSSRAQDSAATNSEAAEIDALKKEIQVLEQKVNALEQRQAAEKSATPIPNGNEQVGLNQPHEPGQTSSSSHFTAGANGLNFSSADSNFVVVIHGLVQVDGREFFADGGIKGNDGILIRRSRPIILSGTVYRDFDFQLTPDFGGSTVQILDAYVNYRYRPELQLQAGKFKSPIGLEALQSDTGTSFNERSLATDLVPNRDLGAALHGDLFGGAASYAAGLFDGSPDFSGSTTNFDYDNNKAFVARVFIQPWKSSDVTALRGFGFGVGGSFEDDRAVGASASGLTPGYTTDGQQKFFTYTNGAAANGQHWRISPQAYYYYGPFSLLGEYAISDQQVRNAAGTTADLRNSAWEISGSWFLTGEDAGYNGVTPMHPFNPRNGQWGAWQLVARYAALDVDDAAFPLFANPNTSASAARAWSAGVNWYLNKNLRMNTSFSRTTFTGGDGPGATVTKQPENVFFTRLQLAF